MCRFAHVLCALPSSSDMADFIVRVFVVEMVLVVVAVVWWWLRLLVPLMYAKLGAF